MLVKMAIERSMLYKKVCNYRARRHPANQIQAKHDANSHYNPSVSSLLQPGKLICIVSNENRMINAGVLKS